MASTRRAMLDEIRQRSASATSASGSAGVGGRRSSTWGRGAFRTTRTTAVFVTHQINEAVYLADRVVVFSGRPGRVREEVSIDLTRPRELRTKRTPEFLAYEDHIWHLIEHEVKQALEPVA